MLGTRKGTVKEAEKRAGGKENDNAEAGYAIIWKLLERHAITLWTGLGTVVWLVTDTEGDQGR